MSAAPSISRFARALCALAALASILDLCAQVPAHLLPLDPVTEYMWGPETLAIRPGPLNVFADSLPSVDVSNRESVRAFYAAAWSNVTYPDLGAQWTGSYLTKTPGDIMPEWRRIMLNRLNAFRTLAGVPTIPATAATWDAYAQEAAFAMSANGVLTHSLSPAVAPVYWSHRAALAAYKSNIAASIPVYKGGTPIDDFIIDLGLDNTAVGHRFSLLNRYATHAGIGIAPYWKNAPQPYPANGAVAGAAVMVDEEITGAGRQPIAARERLVAWPNRGYFPLQLMDGARWSVFSDLVGSNPETIDYLDSATVEVYQDGVKLDVAAIAAAGRWLVYLVDPKQLWGDHPWTKRESPEPTTYAPFPDRDVRFITRIRGIKTIDKAPRPDYFFSTVVFDAESNAPQSAPLVNIPAIAAAALFAGDATQVLSDVRHPNGNIYDQLQLTGSSATFRADPGQVTRLSYIDLNDDIVQVEFSGAGRVHIVLDAFTALARPVLYNQDVDYVRGHARIYVAEADASTYLTVFSVGRANAVNQALFREGAPYDGVADLQLVAVSSPSGKMGGLFLGNVSFWGTAGYTGLHAPAVSASLVRVGDIEARDAAIPVLLTGSVAEILISGGSLEQANGWPLFIGSAAAIVSGDGSTSHGLTLAKQANRAVLYQDDRDVTASLTR